MREGTKKGRKVKEGNGRDGAKVEWNEIGKEERGRGCGNGKKMAESKISNKREEEEKEVKGRVVEGERRDGRVRKGKTE